MNIKSGRKKITKGLIKLTVASEFVFSLADNLGTSLVPWTQKFILVIELGSWTDWGLGLSLNTYPSCWSGEPFGLDFGVWTKLRLDLFNPVDLFKINLGPVRPTWAESFSF